MNPLLFLAIPFFITVGFVVALFPRVLPRLTNVYYSKLGMKTRVAEEDYSRLSTRLVGGVMALIGVFLIYRWLVLGR
jgi:hypothetical protein